jgi:hypothetical protein
MSRWWDQFEFLSLEARQHFGGLLTQLDALGLSLLSRRAQTQPAGWAGLARRGPWSRLLTSEWALAQEHPDEFLRRVGQQELHFWELAEEPENQQLDVWVWLDTGSDQLGAARVVQMALLLWLAHRCQKSGGQLRWASVQHPEVNFEGFALSEVRAYLKLRSLEPGRSPVVMSQGLNWAIGSASWLSQVQANFKKIELTQIDNQQVALRHGPRQVILQLPPAEAAGHLLQDPTRTFHPPRKQGPLQPTYLRFSQCGRKLLLLEEQALTLLPIPSSGLERMGKIRHFPLRRPGTILAVTWELRSLYVAQLHQGQLWLYCQNPARVDQDQCQSGPLPFEELGELGSCWPEKDGWSLCYADQLWHLQAGQWQAGPHSKGGRVLGSRGVLAYDGQLWDLRGKSLGSCWPEADCWRLWIGGLSPRYHWTLAFQQSLDLYQLHWDKKTAEVRCSWPVLGVVEVAGRATLLAQSPEGLWLIGEDGQQRLKLGHLPEQACLHPDGLLAYRSAQGDLGIYSFTRGSTVWSGRL